MGRAGAAPCCNSGLTLFSESAGQDKSQTEPFYFAPCAAVYRDLSFHLRSKRDFCPLPWQ